MKLLLKGFKTEINPSKEQIVKINKTIGTCRYIYNFYLAHNKELYDKGDKFKSGKSFSVWLNNEYLPNNPDKLWIKDVSSKAVKKSIENGCTAFMRFFNHQSNYPKFKKKDKSDVKMYFVRSDAKSTIKCERHRIKIPTLGWVRLKEKGYIPTTKDGYIIKSGTISKKAGRYYVSVLVELPEPNITNNSNDGIGIDLGIKDLAIVSDGKVFKNINKSSKVKRLEKRLRREQRRLSRKYEFRKKKGGITAIASANIDKQKLKVQKIHHHITTIREDYENKTVHEIVKQKPRFITVEDLNVKGMMKNRHLAKAIAAQRFNHLLAKLKRKAEIIGIELREVDRFYPSSKTCHTCGHIHKGLKLKDRMYACPKCGYTADRDYNASLNLRDAKEYRVS